MLRVETSAKVYYSRVAKDAIGHEDIATGIDGTVEDYFCREEPVKLGSGKPHPEDGCLHS